MRKTCSCCGREKALTDFQARKDAPDGRRSQCAECLNKAKRGATTRRAERYEGRDAVFHVTIPVEPLENKELDARRRRIESDHEALKLEDFDTSVANDHRCDAKAAAEKRQEFSRSMGEFAEGLRDPEELLKDEKLGGYVGRLAEQERRFGNRRLARSVSLQAAHEALALRQFKQAAATYLADKITPTGYALRLKNRHLKRSLCLHLSDLHLGAELSDFDNPMPFRAVEEARRLEFVVRQAVDWKPQYRDDTELVLLLNGDLIEGLLLHDLRDGAPLTEQKVVFWRYFRAIVGLFAQTFPKVRVECQAGNHGRDRVRHPGRATSSKWDGHEWQMYWALREMSSGLPNVSWNIPTRGAHLVDLHGSKLLLTHGDTELLLGDPDTRSTQNAQVLDRANATRLFGEEFDACAFGHFHKPRLHPRDPVVVWNGALVPPNGHARSRGYFGEPCGQWLWEAVEGFPVGDARFIKVGPEQDRDERLGNIVVPFRFE